MSKNLKSLADRLILLVARLGERATVQNITGRHLVGAEFKQAKQDAAALVVWEPIYQMRQRRPGWGAQRSRKASTTAKLTKAGIWRAAALGMPFSPTLVDALIAESEKPAPHSRAEKQREAETAALISDGKEFRRQNAARKTAKDEAAKAALVGPRRKRSPRHYEKLNKFLVSRGMQPAKVPAFGNALTLRQPEQLKTTNIQVRAAVTAYEAQSPKAGGCRPPAENSAPAQPAAPARPAPADDFTRDYLNMQRDLATIHEPNREFSNLPKPADVAENARIIELFKKTPCSGELLPNGRIRYDNQDMTPKRWEIERFKQSE